MTQAPSPSSNDLLTRVAGGEAAAVDELLARYRPLVWSIVRGRVPHESAEDVVQEVFIQLWKSAERFDPEKGSEVTFVSTIAHRRLIDRQRSEEVRGGTEPIPESFVAEEQGMAAVETKDEAEHAERALSLLRPEQQEVLRMSISGLSHREIARQTKAPLGTVKSHARRGLERVRRLLEESDE